MAESNGILMDRRTWLKATSSVVAPLLMCSASDAQISTDSAPAKNDDFRTHLLACLGGEWPQVRRDKFQIRVEAEPVKKDGYTLEHVSFAAVGDPIEPADRIPAFVLV